MEITRSCLVRHRRSFSRSHAVRTHNLCQPGWQPSLLLQSFNASRSRTSAANSSGLSLFDTITCFRGKAWSERPLVLLAMPPNSIIPKTQEIGNESVAARARYHTRRGERHTSNSILKRIRSTETEKGGTERLPRLWAVTRASSLDETELPLDLSLLIVDDDVSATNRGGRIAATREMGRGPSVLARLIG